MLANPLGLPIGSQVWPLPSMLKDFASFAETISKIDRTEDFTRQQDYIRQSAQTLGIDETGFTSLVNKFIRNRDGWSITR